MTVSAFELELPVLDIVGLERDEALAAASAVREQHWLARSPLGFAVTRYRDAVAVLRDRRFHSALSQIPRMAGVDASGYFANRRPSILSMEGDEHARLRRLVAPAFTPASADRLRPVMRAVVAGLVDAVVPAGRCDLVADVCEPYPIPIICELLGAPKADWRRFSAWATDIFRIFNQDLERDLPAIARASDELGTYVRAMIEERRSSPADDLLSDLIAVEEAGDRLDTDEMAMLAEAVLMAGTDTTRNQLACSMALLASHPDQWELLRASPELAPRAVEETMRYLGAVRGTVRFASEDITYRDVTFPAGTLVSVAVAAANRDPEVVDEPDTFDLTRERANTHLTFGSGIHHCLGAALARAELSEALVVLAERMPALAFDGPVTWKPSTFGIWGPATLPLRFA
ncbi:MAG: cytochrome P450 [Actinomycetota bacterium]|jgi:cytochrome P450|nr:cytochrome P450 [Actinomycetota bacterium]